MNEILGPIYYAFALDQSELCKGHAEADAFFAFTQVMGEIMNNFCETLDHSSLGIKAQLSALNQLLKKHDYELWNDLVG
jgi:TBC1 domain family member 13